MIEPTRIEIILETLAVEGMTGPEAAALVAATERALNAYYAARTEPGASGPTATTAEAVAATLAAAIRAGRAG
jgi:hypothetical protein